MQDRPDPDALLQRIQQEQAQQQRGRLKVFFGACAGVGTVSYTHLTLPTNREV